MRWHRRFFRRGLTERQLDAELRFHLEQQTADFVAAGMTPEEARRRARLEFGGLDQVKEECRDVGAARFMETLLQDMRYGVRMLRKNPAFTAAAVVTLALGIGGATAIFNATDETLLSPLPLPEPQQLVAVYNFDKKAARYVSSSYPDYEDFSQRSQSFQHLSAYVRLPLNLSIGGSTEGVSVEAVSTDYFSMLELPPLAGRAFAREDGESSSAQPVAMVGEEALAETLWGSFESDWEDDHDCEACLPCDRRSAQTLPRRQPELG